MTRWQPCLELHRLLEALSEEILAASDEELRQVHGSRLAVVAGEVSLRIRAARTEAEARSAGDIGAGAAEPGTAARLEGAPPRSSHQRH